VLIYGPDGVGKSTFAANAPDTIFLGPESGTNHLDVSRLPVPDTFNDVLADLEELRKDPHDYKTLAVDSLDWLEPLLYQQICKDYGVKSIELAAGGYGKGYVELVERWKAFIGAVDKLRNERKMNIILIAHSTVVTFNDPLTASPYDRYELKLYKKSSPIFREWVDAVLFANFQIFTKKDGSNVVGDGVRVMYTERRPGWDAKNRMGLPLLLNLGWEDYASAANVPDVEKPEVIIDRIYDMLQVNETEEGLRELVTQTIAKANNNVDQLIKIENRLKIRLNINV
jgi:hypothetical protein